MLSFLWHFRGSVPLVGVTDQEALDRVEDLLERQGKPVLDSCPNGLSFDAPFWNLNVGSNWDALALFDRGQFRIEQGLDHRVLRYRMRCLHGFLFCLFAAALIFAMYSRGHGSAVGVAAGGLTFGGFYGMNLLLAFIRVPSLLARTVRVR